MYIPSKPTAFKKLLVVAAISLTLAACSSDDDSSGTNANSADGGMSDTGTTDTGTTDTGTTDTGTTDTGTTDTGTTDTGTTDTGTTDTGTTDTGTTDVGAADAGSTELSLAFVATGSFPTGQIERINLNDGYSVDATYPATTSDILAKTDNVSLYQLGRLNLDSLTKFSPTDTSVTGFQYSTNDTDGSGSNPSDVIFVNDTKAYILRYGSPIVWIVNPSAESEAEFKTGELDLSAYDPDTSDEDLSPNADSAVVVDGKLFILMQRLSVFAPIEQGYVAVFDTTSDLEIDTMTDTENGLKGIPLNTLNPTDIRFNPVTEEIYVTGRGNIFVEFNSLPSDPFQGGLIAIDQTTYATSKLLDDGDASSNMGMGFIQDTLVLNDTKGYVTLYQNSDPDTFAFINAVHEFNPSTGEVGEPLGAVVGKEIGPMTMGSDGNVWISNRGSTPGLSIVDPSNDSVETAFAPTSFTPINVVFMTVPE